jgi:hypothetical protein
VDGLVAERLQAEEVGEIVDALAHARSVRLTFGRCSARPNFPLLIEIETALGHLVALDADQRAQSVGLYDSAVRQNDLHSLANYEEFAHQVFNPWLERRQAPLPAAGSRV